MQLLLFLLLALSVLTNVLLIVLLVRGQSPAQDTTGELARLVREEVEGETEVLADQLRTIVGVNANVASAMNRQVLRFRALTAADSPDMVNALRQLLFREEIRPYTATAYIIVYSTIPEERYVDIDLGISLQSMSLKAVELGLNCLIKGNIDKNGLRELFPEPANLEPVAVLCVGKKDESVFLKPVSSSEDLTPYTKDDVHYVPKLTLDDLML